MKVLLFTDTLCDANGVSRFLQDMAAESAVQEREFFVVTSTLKEHCDPSARIFNLPPLFRAPMPLYPELDIVVPPVIAMYRLIRRIDPDLIHISTPGTVGWSAMLLARLAGKPIVGTYHTDFPGYIYHNTKSRWLHSITTIGMRLFYRPFSMIFVRTSGFREILTRDLGVPESKIVRLAPGIRQESFDARFRDTALWRRYGLSESSLKLLYVGRLTKEKNFGMVMRAWELFYERYVATGQIDADLVIVGEGKLRNGPKASRLKRTAFLGYRGKEELSGLYASSDLFICPSVTETLGQVIMEAQSSGLPVLVADRGGHREIVCAEGSRMLNPDEPEQWCEAVAEYLSDPKMREESAQMCRSFMQPFTIARSFRAFWDAHERLMAQGETAKTVSAAAL